MVTGIYFALVLVVGASVWYYKDRSTLAFVVAFCAYAALGLVVVKYLTVVIFLALVAAVVYGYIKKPEVIAVVKKFVDDKIDTIVDIG